MYNELQSMAIIKAAENAGQGQLICSDLQFYYIIAGLFVIALIVIFSIFKFFFDIIVNKFGKTEDEIYEARYRKF